MAKKKEGDESKKRNLASQLEGGGSPGLSEESLKKWSRLIAEAWADDKLKKRLIDKPAAVLREHGIEIPPGMEVRIVEDTAKVHHLVLPPKPAGDLTELTSSELADVAALMCTRCVWPCAEPGLPDWIPWP